MTVTYPPQPWSEGDKFFNETTLVQYTYNGVAWIAEGGPAPDDGEYLPLTGGDLSGLLNINVNNGTALTINTNKVKFWSSGAVEVNGYTAFKDNELITKAYTDNAIKTAVEGIDVPSPFRQLRFARDKDWNNLRPGEFGLMDKSNNNVAQWSGVYQIYFLGVDTDGNRLIRDENMKSWSSFVGSAVTVLTSSGTRPLLRAVPTGQAGGLVMLEWDKEQDLFYIGWSDSKCASLMTGTNDNLSNGQNFLFHIPDLFF